jgi:hypothetical protein
MRYVYFNPNPEKKSVGDCVIRSICKVTDMNWLDVFDLICNRARSMHDMPSANAVWSSVLNDLGFKRYAIPNSCPYCYTIEDFCYDHPHGSYVLSTGTHAVGVKNGHYFDSWDSGSEIPIYYFKEEQI